MISKAKAKLIRKLRSKKHRLEAGLFIAEGPRIIRELLSSDHRIVTLFRTEEFSERTAEETECIDITADELREISSLQEPNQVLAIAQVPTGLQSMRQLPEGLYLALEDIRDPGNLGTLLRTADWFGVDGVFCSPGTVDTYNPKVVQASMGSIARQPARAVELNELLHWNRHLPVYGSSSQGENVYEIADLTPGILLIGNEARGLDPQLATAATRQLAIPGQGGAESLNAAVAAGILLAEFRRRGS